VVCSVASINPLGWYSSRQTTTLATTGVIAGMKKITRKMWRPLIRGVSHAASPSEMDQVERHVEHTNSRVFSTTRPKIGSVRIFAKLPVPTQDGVPSSGQLKKLITSVATIGTTVKNSSPAPCGSAKPGPHHDVRAVARPMLPVVLGRRGGPRHQGHGQLGGICEAMSP